MMRPMQVFQARLTNGGMLELSECKDWSCSTVIVPQTCCTRKCEAACDTDRLSAELEHCTRHSPCSVAQKSSSHRAASADTDSCARGVGADSSGTTHGVGLPAGNEIAESRVSGVSSVRGTGFPSESTNKATKGASCVGTEPSPGQLCSMIPSAIQ